jgi:hypothetical protein
MRKDCLHGSLLGLKSEIRFNSGTEAQIGLAGNRAYRSSEQPARIGADCRLSSKQPRVGGAPRQEGGVGVHLSIA